MKSPFIKICGITNDEDLEMILSYSPDAIGMIFAPFSPRHISTEVAKQLSQKVEDFQSQKQVIRVGVFVDQSVEIVESVVFETEIDAIQLHGSESPEYCEQVKKRLPTKEVWKAFRISKEEDLTPPSDYSCCDRLLFDAFSEDAHGGTGKRIPLFLLLKISSFCSSQIPFLIAGGIDSQNVAEILRLSHANGVDLSSSLEDFPGKKSPEKVPNFFSSLKNSYFAD